MGNHWVDNETRALLTSIACSLITTTKMLGFAMRAFPWVHVCVFTFAFCSARLAEDNNTSWRLY